MYVVLIATIGLIGVVMWATRRSNKPLGKRQPITMTREDAEDIAKLYTDKQIVLEAFNAADAEAERKKKEHG